MANFLDTFLEVIAAFAGLVVGSIICFKIAIPIARMSGKRIGIAIGSVCGIFTCCLIGSLPAIWRREDFLSLSLDNFTYAITLLLVVIGISVIAVGVPTVILKIIAKTTQRTPSLIIFAMMIMASFAAIIAALTALTDL